MEIPTDWDEVTPAWMTAALATHHPDAVVSKVEVLLRDDGTNRRARLGLQYSSGDGPATVFVKAADPAHTKLNAATGGVFNECLLFQAGVPLPVDHPTAYLALIDEDRLDFILVMEDVTTRGGDPRDSTRPYSAEQAAGGARALARLHSAYWGSALDACEPLAWVEPLRAWTGMAIGIDIGIKRAGDRLPEGVRALPGEEIEEGHWARYVDTLAEGPATLLHGDAHIGNTYALPGDDVGFLDWQVLRRGNLSLDLGYFVQGAITVADRRAHERAIVGEYHAALDVPAAEKPSFDEVWLRYRASVAHGLALWLATAASTWQRQDVSLALAERYAHAFVDLDTPAAIAELR